MRLFIIPFLVIEILDGHYRMAFALFILAGISDALDGLLARWLSQKTTLGQYLDPIADKLLLSTLFVVLTHVGLIPRYVTVLVFSRDLGILLISTLLFADGYAAGLSAQSVWQAEYAGADCGLDCGALREDLCSAQLATLRDVLVRAIAVLAPLSAAQYAWIVFRRMNTPRSQP